MRNLYIIICLAVSYATAFSQSSGGPIPGAGQPPGQSFPHTLGSPTGPINNIPYDISGPGNPGNDPQDPGHVRTIFWIHGLNSNPDAWSRAAAATQTNVAPGFPARKVECVTNNMTYSQNAGLWFAGRGLKHNIQNYLAGSGQTVTKFNFNIAHSQGGIVSRAMFHNLYCSGESQGNLFGTNGLVTFGTPHQGARLLNNQNQFVDMADRICQRLGRAYAFWFLTRDIEIKLPLGIKISKSLSDITDPGELARGFCDLFQIALFQRFADEITPPITDHYQVGSQQLQELNNSCEAIMLDTMHKMAFYGIEDTVGIMFRTLFYFENDPNEDGYFTADPDEFWMDEFKSIENNFVARLATLKAEKAVMILNFTNINCHRWPISKIEFCKKLMKKIDDRERAIQAHKVALRTIRTMNETYRAIIGALEYNALPAECVCKDELGNEVYRGPYTGPIDCSLKSSGGPRITCEKEVKFSRDVKDSDGVVLAESASNMPAATHMPIQLRETSHMQMRNNSELRRTLRTLYNGSYDPWFKCEVK